MEPEEALRQPNAKLDRFRHIESRLRERGHVGVRPLEELEPLWEEAERAERGG